MQLSQEDSLRLNVLLNQPLQAVRIDDGKMIVHGLTEKGEAKIQLHPNCKDEVYVKRVKELISTHVLGSPGGYPVFLKRWTRMGQTRSESLERLLKLGEPEAVVAVVGAPGITDEIARRAWWAMPSADNARRMLAQQDVVQGEMGTVLAEFLLEFLPFEEEPKNIIKSVELVLQPGLISDEERMSLWKKGQRKNAFLVGFLCGNPDNLPVQARQSEKLPIWQEQLCALSEQGNVIASLLLKVLSEEGQAFLDTLETVMKKPSNQDVIVVLFEAIEQYFSAIRPHNNISRDFDASIEEVQQVLGLERDCDCSDDIKAVKNKLDDCETALEAVLALSYVGEQLLAPVFATTDAVGSVMRKKIAPITEPLMQRIQLLKSC